MKTQTSFDLKSTVEKVPTVNLGTHHALPTEVPLGTQTRFTLGRYVTSLVVFLSS